MPGKKNNNSKKNKQGSRRGSRRRMGRTRDLPLQAQQPLAKRTLVTYGQASTFGEGAAGIGGVVFYRLNSIYDPDLTGVGVSALGLGYWANFYASYRVLRATVRLQGAVSGMSASGLGCVIMAPTSQSTAPATKIAWRAAPYSSMACVTNSNTSGDTVSLVATYDLAKVLRITPSEYRNDMDFTGGTASNPARAVNVQISVDSAGSAAIATLTYNIQITYEVEWFNPLFVQ